MIFALLLFWGGAFVGIYTIMLTIVDYRFSAVTSPASLPNGPTWVAGALIGPLLAGAATQAVPHRLALFVAFACALFTAVALRLKTSPPRA